MIKIRRRALPPFFFALGGLVLLALAYDFFTGGRLLGRFGDLVYANSRGEERSHPLWIAVTHLFNHQTHHRGQLTTLLSQAGIDPGVTDFFVPAIAFLGE